MMTAKPRAFRDLNHAMAQAAMWRRYAQDWDRPMWHDRRRWVEGILKIDRSECLRRAREAIVAAQEFSRKAS